MTSSVGSDKEGCRASWSSMAGAWSVAAQARVRSGPSPVSPRRHAPGRLTSDSNGRDAGGAVIVTHVGGHVHERGRGAARRGEAVEGRSATVGRRGGRRAPHAGRGGGRIPVGSAAGRGRPGHGVPGPARGSAVRAQVPSAG